ncbi:magnesium transporter CorA family protein [Longibaculum muris]|uniref:magnesium transporter CorA family protein n=1 Tax=Longibaculum muris TaxID=1796628 RepID=UPI0022E6401F|nr:CorA family divalent cation transporter [Longibaculum muris]
MIYQVDNQKLKVKIQDIQDNHMYIAMMSLDELKTCYREYHITERSLLRCEETSMLNQNIIIPHQQYYYGLINLINARDVFVKKDSLAFFIFKNLFLVVVIDDEDHHISEVFQSSSDYVLEKGVSITRLVYYFLSELISRDYQYIEDLQEEIEDLESHDSEEESIHFTNQLRQLSKELLLLRNYYDNLVIIGEDLQMNHHHIFEDDDMRYFEIFTRRIERLSNNVQMLRELLSQAYEAHQSKLDYKLNKTMQFFTVVTTVFMPLTLIAGWYGMNFKNMPELSSPYGYLSVILVSVSVVVLLMLWFKKKKFL